LIEAQKISHSYGSSKVINRLDFQISPGEITALTGKNGSGKSTLIKIIAGVVSPVRGVMKIPSGLTTKIVAPYLQLYDELTLSQHYSLLNCKGSLAGAMEFWELPSKISDRPLGQFSSGMLQRARFILSFNEISLENGLILLDEPHSNLDTAGIEKVQTLITSLATNSNYIIIASNDVDEYRGATQIISI
jgi:ABC-type multidrug transport system ATPase subunit